MSRLYLALEALEQRELTPLLLQDVLQDFLTSHADLARRAYLDLHGELLLRRPLLLICRSGHRSVYAGEALEAVGFSTVINVLEGFEGPLDDDYHRGTMGGWRHHGLPWQQA